MTPQERVIEIARAEVGYLEKKTNSQLDSKTANAGSGNWTKYARDLDDMGVYNGRKNGYAWCDVFADWCYIQAFGLDTAMKMTCQPMGGYGAGTTNSAQYYMKNKQFIVDDPQPGDQIFFSKNNGQSMYHTGIVSRVSGGRVYTIEGNTSSAAGVVENGGAVAEKYYPLSYNRIAGYGRPKWSLAGDMEDEDMTQEKFNEMMDNYLAQREKQPPSGWSAEARAWAEGIDMIKGDENGNKQYKMFPTREALIVFLYRFFQYCFRDKL